MNTIIDTNRSINFGIYRCSKVTPYGNRITGIYKDKIIDIYNDTNNNMKLYYISDLYNNWIKSKLVYYIDNIKHITKSNNNSIDYIV